MPASPATPTPPPTAPGRSFAELGVPATLTAVLAARGITTPRLIQAHTVRDGLAGRDVLGRAETGSGKTLAFGLPLLVRTATVTSQARARQPRALVLVPTRELADQVHAELVQLGAALGLRLLDLLRQGAAGTVITLVLPEQTREVAQLHRRAQVTTSPLPTGRQRPSTTDRQRPRRRRRRVEVAPR